MEINNQIISYIDISNEFANCFERCLENSSKISCNNNCVKPCVINYNKLNVNYEGLSKFGSEDIEDANFTFTINYELSDVFEYIPQPIQTITIYISNIGGILSL